MWTSIIVIRLWINTDYGIFTRTEVHWARVRLTIFINKASPLPIHDQAEFDLPPRCQLTPVSNKPLHVKYSAPRVCQTLRQRLTGILPHSRGGRVPPSRQPSYPTRYLISLEIETLIAWFLVFYPQCNETSCRRHGEWWMTSGKVGSITRHSCVHRRKGYVFRDDIISVICKFRRGNASICCDRTIVAMYRVY